jgi:hypothetical protein
MDPTEPGQPSKPFISSFSLDPDKQRRVQDARSIIMGYGYVICENERGIMLHISQTRPEPPAIASKANGDPNMSVFENSTLCASCYARAMCYNNAEMRELKDYLSNIHQEA